MRKGGWAILYICIYIFLLLLFIFFIFFFQELPLSNMCFGCTHFLHGNSCQNTVGLQCTTNLELILESGRGQEVRRSPTSELL